MCGRFTQAYTWHELVALYRLTQAAANLQPHYNIATTDSVDVVPMRDGKAKLAPMVARCLTIDTVVLMIASAENRCPISRVKRSVGRLSSTERKRLRSIVHTCGLPGGRGGWWFWPRRHLQLVS